jgi:predicted nuclease with TOPRIM domain
LQWLSLLEGREGKEKPLKEKLSRRLDELKAELKAGQQMEAELKARLEHVRATLLRISGAIQVLEEMLDSRPAAPELAAQLPDHVEPHTVNSEASGKA